MVGGGVTEPLSQHCRIEQNNMAFWQLPAKTRWRVLQLTKLICTNQFRICRRIVDHYPCVTLLSRQRFLKSTSSTEPVATNISTGVGQAFIRKCVTVGFTRNLTALLLVFSRFNVVLVGRIAVGTEVKSKWCTVDSKLRTSQFARRDLLRLPSSVHPLPHFYMKVLEYFVIGTI